MSQEIIDSAKSVTDSISSKTDHSFITNKTDSKTTTSTATSTKSDTNSTTVNIISDSTSNWKSKTKEVLIDGKIVYNVPEHMELIKKVGSGSYGCVASFTDTQKNRKVAVKKITNAFADLIDGKRILREIKLLRHFKHENIIQILDLYPPTSRSFDDIYIVTDLMETDLHRVIYSKQALSEEHAQYFIYQTLRGLHYLHSCSVVHRDLKPSNLLVNKNCDLKICDFGLARGISTSDSEDTSLTDYVVTRWYRAPEVVLAASSYSDKIDVWSVGCILFEILARKPLFQGKDHLDQIRKIIEKMGTPKEEDLLWIPESGPSRKFLGKCEYSEGMKIQDLLTQATSQNHTNQSNSSKSTSKTESSNFKPPLIIYSEPTIDFLTKLLTFDPTKRISVKQALNHVYIKYPEENIDGEDLENNINLLNVKTVDWQWDNELNDSLSLSMSNNKACGKSELQKLILNEIRGYYPEVVRELLQGDE